MVHQKIFIASPGDVSDERALARGAIERVRSEHAFRGRTNLECMSWDQPGAGVAMDAALTPQAAIELGLPKPSECDIVIVIFWSRMGTVLPADYGKKPDGSAYLSGTEWEFFDALQAAKRNSKPAVWLYRRTGAPRPAFDDPEYDDKRVQWANLVSFFAALNDEDGAILGGVNSYDTPDGFERLLEGHLRDRLSKLLDAEPREQRNLSAPENNEKSAALWKGSPYPGLEAFTAQQEKIFFGRGRETGALLQNFSKLDTRFIAVVGSSGSGKSSLVNAGLIPRLQAGALPGSQHWLYLSFKPTEQGIDPFLAFAHSIKPLLCDSGLRELDLAGRIYNSPDWLAGELPGLFEARPHSSELLLFIDQFEELFSSNVDKDYRQKFLEFLHRSVAVPRVRVVVTMRADFYPRALEFPILADLLRESGTFPLSAPSPGALHDMILRPAQIAGLELEGRLVATVMDDTGVAPGGAFLDGFRAARSVQESKSP